MIQAVLQFKPQKGQRAANLRHLGEVLETLPEVDVLMLPETALSGYFLQGGVRELAVTAKELFAEISNLHSKFYKKPLDIVVGFYEKFNDAYFNSSLYAEFGTDSAGIRHVHRKVFLPTYGVFDEDRFLSRGSNFEVFTTRFGQTSMLICEDAWHSISATICALKGAQLIYVPLASPSRGFEGPEPTNVGYWRKLVQGIAAEHGVYVIASSLVGFEAGKAFSGNSLIIHPDGRVLIEAPLFEESLLIAEIGLDEINATRFENPLLSDLKETLPRVLPSLLEAIDAND